MKRNSDAIEEIKSRINIVDLVSRTVDLKKAGTNYKGLCPFHHEKTPSFVVSETKQIFTCFGCGKTGDVIEYEKQIEGLDFMEAVEKLAKECGVTIDKSYGGNKNKDLYYEINRQAARFFYKSLRAAKNPGLSYMQQRGVTPESLRKFGIGYADESWTGLYEYLKKCGFEEEHMLELGLIAQSKGRYYDKFRQRVMFPILNTAGKVIGFGGRALGDAMPKYLNSRESSVFLKKNNLYGLHLSKNIVGSSDFIILVEGYMDVIGLHQYGVENTAASLGTALTESQANLIKRYTKNVVLCYDADGAGQAAALRGMDILHNAGIKVRVMQVTDEKDPDEFVKARGKVAFEKLVDEALPFADYKLKAIKKKHDINDRQGRIDFLEEAAGVLNQLQPVEADMYAKGLAQKFGISQQAIRSQQQMGKNPVRAYQHRRHNGQNQEQLTTMEKTMLKILLAEIAYIDRDMGIDKVFTSFVGKRIFDVIKRQYQQEESFSKERVLQQLSPEDALVLQQVENQEVLGSMDTVFRDCLHTVKKQQLEEEEDLLITRLSLADEEENQTEIRQLTEQLIQIQKELKLLKQ